jgi:hypothetical protein
MTWYDIEYRILFFSDVCELNWLKKTSPQNRNLDFPLPPIMIIVAFLVQNRIASLLNQSELYKIEYLHEVISGLVKKIQSFNQL